MALVECGPLLEVYRQADRRIGFANLVSENCGGHMPPAGLVLCSARPRGSVAVCPPPSAPVGAGSTATPASAAAVKSVAKTPANSASTPIVKPGAPRPDNPASAAAAGLCRHACRRPTALRPDASPISSVKDDSRIRCQRCHHTCRQNYCRTPLATPAHPLPSPITAAAPAAGQEPRAATCK